MASKLFLFVRAFLRSGLCVHRAQITYWNIENRTNRTGEKCVPDNVYLRGTPSWACVAKSQLLLFKLFRTAFYLFFKAKFAMFNKSEK